MSRPVGPSFVPGLSEAHSVLDAIDAPADVRRLSGKELDELAAEIRRFIVESVSANGGHLGPNLGVVELTLALHRVFDSPRDIILWDTGHQAYVHKIITGRRSGFGTLRKADGLSGYPSRAESEHDWVENSHASTILSYAHGLAVALANRGERHRRIVAVLGDGSLTGGMAYEALNNLGHGQSRVLIVLNDNGRSYAPTIGPLAVGLARVRASGRYVRSRELVKRALHGVPVIGESLERCLDSVRAGLRLAVSNPSAFFEALGVRYVGPVDGHDIPEPERLLTAAQEASEMLDRHGVRAAVWDVRVVKPLDPAMLAAAVTFPLVVIAEDGVRRGGAGSAIETALSELARQRGALGPSVLTLGVPDRFLPHRQPQVLLSQLGLDGPGLASAVLSALSQPVVTPA